MIVCPGPADSLGAVRGVLGSVDCQVEGYAKAAYLALSGPQSFFPAALTSLLVIWVALIGFRMMFGIGQVRVVDAPVLALKLGIVLSLVFNWSLFETLVFNVAADAPYEVAKVVSEPLRAGGSTLAADPLMGLQSLYDEIGTDAEDLGHKAGPNPVLLQGGEALASQKLWTAQSTLFISTAGILAMAMIAVGILTALGPVFIALALLAETSGLFWGWLRALVGVALLPLLCWTTTMILLVTAEPWAQDLANGRASGHIRLATVDTLSLIVFVFAAAQAALTAAGLAIAGGLGLPGRSGSRASTTPAADAVTIDSQIARGTTDMSRADRLALTLGAAGGGRRRGGSEAGIMRIDTTGAATGSSPAAVTPDGASARAGDAYWRNAHLRTGSSAMARKTRKRP